MIKWFAAGLVLAIVGLLFWSAMENWAAERSARFGTPPNDWAG